MRSAGSCPRACGGRRGRCSLWPLVRVLLPWRERLRVLVRVRVRVQVHRLHYFHHRGRCSRRRVWVWSVPVRVRLQGLACSSCLLLPSVGLFYRVTREVADAEQRAVSTFRACPFLFCVLACVCHLPESRSQQAESTE